MRFATAKMGVYAAATRGSAAEAEARAADAAVKAVERARDNGNEDNGDPPADNGLEILRAAAGGGFASAAGHSNAASAHNGMAEGSPFAIEAEGGDAAESFDLLAHLLSAADSGRLDDVAAMNTAAKLSGGGKPLDKDAGVPRELRDVDGAGRVGLREPVRVAALESALTNGDELSKGQWSRLASALGSVPDGGVAAAFGALCTGQADRGIGFRKPESAAVQKGEAVPVAVPSIAEAVRTVGQAASADAAWKPVSPGDLVQAAHAVVARDWALASLQRLAGAVVREAVVSATASSPEVGEALAIAHAEGQAAAREEPLSVPPFAAMGFDDNALPDSGRLSIRPEALAAPWLVLGAGMGGFSLQAAQHLSNTTVVSVSWPVEGAHGTGPPALFSSRAAAEAAATGDHHGHLASDPTTGSIISSADVIAPAAALAAVRDAKALLNLIVLEAPVNERLVDALASRAAVADLAVATALRAAGMGPQRAPSASEDGTGAIMPADSTALAIEGLGAAPAQLRFGVVVLLDLAPLAEGRLPHELETYVAAVLRLARYIVLPAALPERRFFSYWASAADMVTAAASASGLRVATHELRSGSGGGSSHGWSGRSWQQPSSAPSDDIPSKPRPSADLLLVAVQTVGEAIAEAETWAAAAEAAAALNKARETAKTALPKDDQAGDKLESRRKSRLAKARAEGEVPKAVVLPAADGSGMVLPAEAEAGALSPAALAGTCVAPNVEVSDAWMSAVAEAEVSRIGKAVEAWTHSLQEAATKRAEASKKQTDAASSSVYSSRAVSHGGGYNSWVSGAASSHSSPHGSPTGSSDGLDSATRVRIKHAEKALSRAKGSTAQAVAAGRAVLVAATGSAGAAVGAMASPLWGNPLEPLPRGLPLDVALAGGVSHSDREHVFRAVVLGGSGRVSPYTRPDRVLLTAYGIDSADRARSGPGPVAAVALVSEPEAGGEEEEEEEEEEEADEEKQHDVQAKAAKEPRDTDDAGKRPENKEPEEAGGSTKSSDDAETHGTKATSGSSSGKPTKQGDQAQMKTMQSPKQVKEGVIDKDVDHAHATEDGTNPSKTSQSDSGVARKAPGKEDAPPFKTVSNDTTGSPKPLLPEDLAGAAPVNTSSSTVSTHAASGVKPRSLRAGGGRKLMSILEPEPGSRDEAAAAGVVSAAAGSAAGAAAALLAATTGSTVSTGAGAGASGLKGSGPAVRPADAGAGVGSRDALWSKAHASVQAGVAGRQGASLAEAWPALQDELEAELHTASGPGSSVLVAGDELTLLASKVARLHPRATVLAAVRSASSVEPTSKLASLLNLRNLLITQGGLTPARVNALAAVPDPFRFQFLGVDWLLPLLHATHAPEAVEGAIGRMLSIASTSFLQLPRWGDLTWATLTVRGGGASAANWGAGGATADARRVAACVRGRGQASASGSEEKGSEPLLGPSSAAVACVCALAAVGGGSSTGAGRQDGGLLGSVGRGAAAADAEAAWQSASAAAGAPARDTLAGSLLAMSDDPAMGGAAGASSTSLFGSTASPSHSGGPSSLTGFSYAQTALGEHAALRARHDPRSEASPLAADDPAAADAPRLGSKFPGENGPGFAPTTEPAGGRAAAYRPLMRLAARALASAGLGAGSVRLILSPHGPAFLRVDAAAWARRSPPPSAVRPVPWPVAAPLRNTGAASSAQVHASTLVSPLPGVSLHTLLVLGVSAEHKADLFRMMLRLPLPVLAAASTKLGWSLEPSAASAAASGSSPATQPPLEVAPWTVRFLPPASAAAAIALEESAATWLRFGDADALAASGGPAARSSAATAAAASSASGGGGGAGGGATSGVSDIASLSPAARAALQDAALSAGAGRLAIILVSPAAALARSEQLAKRSRSLRQSDRSRGVWVWSSSPSEEASSPDGGSEAAIAWAAIASQLFAEDVASGGAPGKFSVIDLESGAGALSLRLAETFPEATVVSVEQSSTLTDLHLAAAMRKGLSNAILCRNEVNPALVKSLYKSPEFLRFLTLGPDVLDLVRRHGRTGAGELLGYAMASAATSFVRVPASASLSLAFTTLFHTYPDPEWISPPAAWGVALGMTSTRHTAAYQSTASSPAALAAMAGAGAGVGEFAAMTPLGGEGGSIDPAVHNRFALGFHPRPVFEASEARLLSDITVSPGGKLHVSASPLSARLEGVTQSAFGELGSGVVRVDVVNMTRHVAHHFQSEKDGHDRTYTLIVQGNETATEALEALPARTRRDWEKVYSVLSKGNHPNGKGVVSVRLTRDKDAAFIPYVTVHGVTLITVLRLGLLAPLRGRAYGQFVHLPLYQDMAPWNIVFLGSQLDYIDYDTKDHTYDAFVPKAYEVMEVLFNYKRTVEDFKQCSSKAGNPYNFPYVSECVKSPDFSGPCKDSRKPVPCGDGRCHSDYISCLRSMAEKVSKEHGPGHWDRVGARAARSALLRGGVPADEIASVSSGTGGADSGDYASLWMSLQASLPRKGETGTGSGQEQSASQWLDSSVGRRTRLANHGRWEMRS